jgi:hypothetical protein
LVEALAARGVPLPDDIAVRIEQNTTFDIAALAALVSALNGTEPPARLEIGPGRCRGLVRQSFTKLQGMLADAWRQDIDLDRYLYLGSERCVRQSRWTVVEDLPVWAPMHNRAEIMELAQHLFSALQASGYPIDLQAAVRVIASLARVEQTVLLHCLAGHTHAGIPDMLVPDAILAYILYRVAQVLPRYTPLQLTSSELSGILDLPVAAGPDMDQPPELVLRPRPRMRDEVEPVTELTEIHRAISRLLARLLAEDEKPFLAVMHERIKRERGFTEIQLFSFYLYIQGWSLAQITEMRARTPTTVNHTINTVYLRMRNGLNTLHHQAIATKLTGLMEQLFEDRPQAWLSST